ncbi:MAG: transporter substrate-binding domain-containing protein [Yoonia sp.]|uniref:transporter substrate-binding domain-containing protein n=1 Tax=Yoonia sp. TaxID=2212373 RepID=UPI003EF5FB3C
MLKFLPINCLVLFMSMMVATVTRAQDYEALTFGYRIDAAPFSSVGGGGPEGYVADICGLVASKLEFANSAYGPIKAVELTGADRFDALMDGRVDVLCGATTVTRDRRKFMDFSIPLYIDGVTAIVLQSKVAAFAEITNDATSTTELRELIRSIDAPIGVLATSTSQDFLERLYAGAKVDSGRIRTYETHADAVDAIIDGEISVYFASSAIARAIVEENATTLYVGDAIYTFEPIAIGLRHQDPELRLAIDIAVSDLILEEGVFSLYEKYFGPISSQQRLLIFSSAIE